MPLKHNFKNKKQTSPLGKHIRWEHPLISKTFHQAYNRFFSHFYVNVQINTESAVPPIANKPLEFGKSLPGYQTIKGKLRVPLGFLVLLIKEFRNGLKWKLKGNFIKVEKKSPRAVKLQISRAAWRAEEGRGGCHAS